MTKDEAAENHDRRVRFWYEKDKAAENHDRRVRFWYEKFYKDGVCSDPVGWAHCWRAAQQQYWEDLRAA